MKVKTPHWGAFAVSTLLAGTVCAANPTERRWNVAEGFVDAPASWQNGASSSSSGNELR